MRLGLIGPVGQTDEALERTANFLHRELRVQRAVYLGIDGAMERVVANWAKGIVGADPADNAVWARAVDACAEANAEAIDAFVEAERERRALSIFDSLPSDGTRFVELVGGRVTVMIHDKANLDEDDIASATMLAFGNASEPMVKQVGSRWFLSPGPLDHFGAMLVEDREDGIHLTLYDRLCRDVRRERLLAVSSGSRVSVSDH